MREMEVIQRNFLFIFSFKIIVEKHMQREMHPEKYVLLLNTCHVLGILHLLLCSNLVTIL